MFPEQSKIPVGKPDAVEYTASVITDAEERGLPIYVLRSNTTAQIEYTLANLLKIEVQEQDSGLHFLLKLNTRRPDAELRELLSSRGINLLPLSAYYRNPDNAPEHTFVFNYSSLDTSMLEQALPVLAEFI